MTAKPIKAMIRLEKRRKHRRQWNDKLYISAGVPSRRWHPRQVEKRVPFHPPQLSLNKLKRDGKKVELTRLMTIASAMNIIGRCKGRIVVAPEHCLSYQEKRKRCRLCNGSPRSLQIRHKTWFMMQPWQQQLIHCKINAKAKDTQKIISNHHRVDIR